MNASSMVDSQDCAASISDEQASCTPPNEVASTPPEPASSTPHQELDVGGAFDHSSRQQHISDEVVGVGGSAGGRARPLEADDERGRTGGPPSQSERARSESGSFGRARRPSQRSRLASEEDDRLWIPPMDSSAPNDYAPPFLQHSYQHHHLHPHHHYLHHHYYNPAAEAANSFVNMHPYSHPQQYPQQGSAEQNAYQAPASSALMESSRYAFGDAHLMLDHNPYHGGLQNPELAGPMPGQGPGAAFQALGVGEVLAELERERKKSAELQCRLSSLEARMGSTGDADRHWASTQNGGKKGTKHRPSVERASAEAEIEESRKTASRPDDAAAAGEDDGAESHVPLLPEVPIRTANRDTAVTWMSREVVTGAKLERLSKDIVSDREDSGDSDDEDEDEEEEDEESEDDKDGEGEGAAEVKRKKEGEQEQQVWTALGAGVDAEGETLDLTEDEELNLPGAHGEAAFVRGGFDGAPQKKRRKRRKERRKGKQREKHLFSTRGHAGELVPFKGPGIMSSYKKAPKVAFCPKEVKRIMESGVLVLKNAQSHTMRKIIVFASLGIRHGCEDLYELDFSHFSVVRRGEPYESPKDPGEHVLYDQIGVRTKMFYPNRENPILCPVRILDEERAMRPAGPSCPACLFLCIKYGGRTRNLPQNEYVRQRMGRNKLKSFGPLMCQMALLVHIRTGSFFFKALGITLLFMAGFPDDLVRQETKYRNLDLLQKYYRSDEEAKGEHLFHPYPTFYPPALLLTAPSTQKTAVAGRGPGKKAPPPILSKPPLVPPALHYMQPLATRSPAAMPFQGLPPQFSPGLPTTGPGPVDASAPPSYPGPALPPAPPSPFRMYSPYHPPMHQGPYMPVPWAPVNSYTPAHYQQSPFSFQPFSSGSSEFLQPYYGAPFRFPPYGQESAMPEKQVAEESGDSQRDSDSGSSGAGRKVSAKESNTEGL